MQLDAWTGLEWMWFLGKKENSTDVEAFDDYKIANNLMRQWIRESHKVGEW